MLHCQEVICDSRTFVFDRIENRKFAMPKRYVRQRSQIIVQVALGLQQGSVPEVTVAKGKKPV
jgi:hypothetical protein